MAYNLPPPWSPGFVLPKNVEDEGVERRAFITKWAPRGSYDAPKVGTGGYAVPQYIQDEGYGQGTFTTAWQPSGTYSGPKVPVWLNQRPQVVKEQHLPGGGKVVTVQPLSDDQPLPKMFEDYGSRAAQMLIAQVAPFPAGQRAAVMKAILDKVDKSLWSRTQDIFKRYVSQGVNPAQAFPQALARAMSAGIAAEIVDAGLRRAAPQANSLLGLGCYGGKAVLGALSAGSRAAFGDDAAMHWVPTAGSVPGHWETSAGVVVPVATPDRDAAAIAAGTVDKTGGIRIGPLVFSKNVTRQANSKHFPNPPDAVLSNPGEVPDDFAKAFHDFLTIPNVGANEAMRSSYLGGDSNEQWSQLDAPQWFTRFGVTATTPVRLGAVRLLKGGMRLPGGTDSFAALKHPDTGEDLLLFARLIEADESQAGKNTSPLQLKFYLAKPPKAVGGFLHGLINVATTPGDLIAQIPGVQAAGAAGAAGVIAVVKVIGEGLDKLGDLACGLINTPGVAQAAGAAGGMVVGIPPTAGAAAGTAGAGLAKGACGGPPPPVPVVPPSSNILPLALLGGGAVVVALLLMDHKRSKKKKAP